MVVPPLSQTGVSQTGVSQTGVSQTGVSQTGVSQTGALSRFAEGQEWMTTETQARS
jgi:hypothetical protein